MEAHLGASAVVSWAALWVADWLEVGAKAAMMATVARVELTEVRTVEAAREAARRGPW